MKNYTLASSLTTHYCSLPLSYICNMYNTAIATLKEVPQLLVLLNSGYRGEASKQGWTTEAHFISGEVRTTATALQQLILQPGSVFLTVQNQSGELVGCVNLQQQNNRLYVGMLCVQPLLQGKGTGKQLLFAAEAYSKQQQCDVMYMKVISVRKELISWYIRHGYKDTGLTEPFPTTTDAGIPTQNLFFTVLEKNIAL
jgi:ribosomal protein S18 acetylase RimI-like enzyme